MTTGYRYARRAEVLGESVYDHAPGAIVLSSGLAYPPFLPDVVREAMEAARDRPAETLQYGPLMGLDDLRDEIAAFVAADGVICNRENVLVAYGAKSALDLACRVFTEPGDCIVVTRPTYMTALQIMRCHGVSFLDVGRTRKDSIPGSWKPGSSACNGTANGCPSFSSTSRTSTTPPASPRRRPGAGAWSIWPSSTVSSYWKTTPYRRLRFEGEPVPPIKSFDRNGVVIALGTVSKILAPGLRVGWAIGPKEVVDRMAMQKADGGSNPFAQRMVAELMRGNKMAKHIGDLSVEMRGHRDAMVDAFREFLPEARIRAPQGGYLPVGGPARGDGCRGARRTRADARRGGQLGPSLLSERRARTPTSASPTALSASRAIREGVRRLGDAWKEYGARA